MNKYTKPSIEKVNLTTEEQVLQFCKTGSPTDHGFCYIQDPTGRIIPLAEIYGPLP